MKPILTAAEMLQADRATIDAGTPSSVLMLRAAEAALALLLQEFDTSGTIPILCGPGNNGGDGFVLARLLREVGKAPVVCYLGAWRDGVIDITHMSADAAREFSALPADIPVTAELCTAGATAAVDAVFGVGLSRAPEGTFAKGIKALSKSGIPTLAIDIPSGVSANTGAALGCTVKATATLAISHRKPGHLLYPGAALCGRVQVADIGILPTEAHCFALEATDLSLLPRRPDYANKGTFGRVLVVGGSVGMSGAGFLAAKGAYRAGAGLVEIFAPRRNRTIYQRMLPEAVLTLYPEKHPDRESLHTALCRADAVAVGMGLSSSPAAGQTVEWVFADTPAHTPLIIDADALNHLSVTPALWEILQNRAVKPILTPHLKEMSRLCQKSVADIAADLPDIAREFAKAHGVILVLKDTRTVITDGNTLFFNEAGNNGMATGGSGDVLAGILAGFAASGMDALDAACLGVLAHAMAGDAAARRLGVRGLMASDLPDALCEVLRQIP